MLLYKFLLPVQLLQQRLHSFEKLYKSQYKDLNKSNTEWYLVENLVVLANYLKKNMLHI